MARQFFKLHESLPMRPALGCMRRMVQMSEGYTNVNSSHAGVAMKLVFWLLSVYGAHTRATQYQARVASPDRPYLWASIHYRAVACSYAVPILNMLPVLLISMGGWV